MQTEFSDDYVSGLAEPDKGLSVLADLKKSFGYVWGNANPVESLQALQNIDDEAMAGWLSAQVMNNVNYNELLTQQNATISPEVFWQAMLEVAKSDTIVSLDLILDDYMDHMNGAKWRELFDSPGNSGDSALAEWFTLNEAKLTESPTFDVIEVIRNLRRVDFGEGPYILNDDVAKVHSAVALGDFTAATQLVEEFSTRYEYVNSQLVHELAVDWSSSDFRSAIEWLLSKHSLFSDPESFQCAVKTMFASRSFDNFELGIELAMGIENDSYRGIALSNLLIPNVTKY